MNVIKYRNLWLGLSTILVIASLISIFTLGFRPGIDFAGGTELELRLEGIKQEAIPAGKTLEQHLVDVYQAATGEETAAQKSGEREYSFESKVISNEAKNKFVEQVKSLATTVTELNFQTVSPTIGAEAIRKAIIAVILALVAIMFYLAYSFRKVPKPTNSWRFGVTTIIALAHDVVILLGVYAIMSHYGGAEIDGMFITAVLTVLGFSVHDTIVTFDRLRENLVRRGGDNFAEKVNDSIVETITRSINTSMTLVLVLLAMVLMGGESIYFFTLSLLMGVIFGTYSSIFVASMFLLLWQQRSKAS